MARSAGSTSWIELSKDRVRIARILGAHGLGGELRVRLHGTDPECLGALSTIWLGARAVALLAVVPGRAGECRVRLEGIGDRTAAEAAAGLWLEARSADLPPTQPGEYYLHELVGCAVEDADGHA